MTLAFGAHHTSQGAPVICHIAPQARDNEIMTTASFITGIEYCTFIGQRSPKSVHSAFLLKDINMKRQRDCYVDLWNVAESKLKNSRNFFFI